MQSPYNCLNVVIGAFFVTFIERRHFVNIEKLLAKVKENKTEAINNYEEPVESVSRYKKMKSGGASLNNANGLFLVLWKGKFAFVVNAKGEIAASVLFDDEGKLAPSSRKSSPVW